MTTSVFIFNKGPGIIEVNGEECKPGEYWDRHAWAENGTITVTEKSPDAKIKTE